MHRVLPLPKCCKRSLSEQANAFADPIAACVAQRVAEVMSIGALLLRPLLRSCNSIIDTVERAGVVERGTKFIQSIIREFRAPSVEQGESAGGQHLYASSPFPSNTSFTSARDSEEGPSCLKTLQNLFKNLTNSGHM